jgi:hypothetical protein
MMRANDLAHTTYNQPRRRVHARRRGALRWLQARTPPTPFDSQWQEDREQRSQPPSSPPPMYGMYTTTSSQTIYQSEDDTVPPIPTSPAHSTSTPEEIRARLRRLVAQVEQSITTSPQAPTPAPAPSVCSRTSSRRQQFGDWLKERATVDPLAAQANVLDEIDTPEALSPACSVRTVSTSDPDPPVRHHPYRAHISPADTLYNLSRHLKDKEIAIRLKQDGTILFEYEHTELYEPPPRMTQLTFKSPPIELPLCEQAIATDISFIAT